MTLVELRSQIPWTRGDLARQAGLEYQTVTRAETGEPINVKSAAALVAALSRGLGSKVAFRDIEGLNVRGVTKLVKEIET